MSSEQDPLSTSPNEESGPLAKNAPLTGYEPNPFDDFHYSETTEIFLQEQSSDSRPPNLHDLEISDDTIGRALSSPLFIQEREEPADRRQAYYSPEESLMSSQSVGHVRTGRPVNELSSLSSNVRENPVATQKKSKFSLNAEQKFRNEFQADYDRRSVQKLNGIIESQRREIDHTLAGDELLRRDQLLLHDGRIEAISRFYVRWLFEKKIDRRSRYYP